MSAVYIANLAKEKKMSLSEAEGLWKKAEKVAGKDANKSVVSQVFKTMMNERSSKKKGTAASNKK